MILIHPLEIAEIQSRAISGPYKITGDQFTTSPGAWVDVVTKADLMYNDSLPYPDIWDCNDITLGYADNTNTTPTNMIGHYTMATAFYYLIKEDAAYGAVAKASILAQVRNTNPNFESYYTLASSAGSMFHFASVANRFLMAFDYCKDLFTGSEITEVTDWYDRAAIMFLNWAEFYPQYNFTDRLNRNYSSDTWGSSALSEYQYYADSNPASWTHKDSGGTFQNRLYRVQTDYNNQTAICMLNYGLYAIYKNDSTMIDRAKIWFEEFIIIGCFPDGTIGEYNRNNASYPQLGTMFYSVITLECCIYFAEALRRAGDNSLYEFSTSTGYLTSAGGTKNIALLLDTLRSNITQSTIRYYDTVTDGNKLDVLGGTTYRYTPELIFAIANKYYNDNNYKDTYLLNNATNDYTYSGPQYLPDGRWSNNVGLLPGVPLYYETEDLATGPIVASPRGAQSLLMI